MSISSARRGVVVLLALAMLATACSGSGDDADPPEAPPSSLAELEPGAELPRLEFCELLPDDAVSDALGEEPADSLTWAPGDEVDGRAVQETGCEWSGTTTTARAWVLARAVDQATAERAVAEAGERRGCRAVAEADFGSPAVRQRCPVPDEPGQLRLRRAGLFGDTWLTCELTGPRAEVVERSEAWCARVVDALDPRD